MEKETQTVEIATIDKIKEIENMSGVKFELDITSIANLAERMSKITSVDDEEFLSLKKEAQQTRKYTVEYFGNGRKKANAISKGMINLQKVVLEIFKTDEDRLIALDKAEKERLVMEVRLEGLPKRKERLTAIKFQDLDAQMKAKGEEFDQWLLGLEDADFEMFIVGRQTAKNEAYRLELEASKAKVEADVKKANEELAAKAAEGERIEVARQEERDKANEALKVEKERLENEKKDIEARRVREIEEAEGRRLDAIRADEAEKQRVIQEEKDKVEAEVKAKAEAEVQRIAEAEAKAGDLKYQAWVDGLGEGSFKFLTTEGGDVEAYKLVGTYAKE